MWDEAFCGTWATPGDLRARAAWVIQLGAAGRAVWVFRQIPPSERFLAMTMVLTAEGTDTFEFGRNRERKVI